VRWEDERYCRLFTRDTTNWLRSPWQAKAVLPLVLRKLDRAGLLQIGQDDVFEAVAANIQLPLEVVEVGMKWWLDPKRATFVVRPSSEGGDELVMPQYLPAQEAKASDKRRAEEHRERVRLGLSGRRDSERQPAAAKSVPVTPCDGVVTDRDSDVTLRERPSQPQHSTAQLGMVGLVGEGVQGENGAPNGAANGHARRQGTRLPEDWQPPAEVVAKYRAKGVDCLASLKRFKNHFLEATGQKAIKLGWTRTFENWIDKDVEDGRARRVPIVAPESAAPTPTETAGPDEEQRKRLESLTRPKRVEDLFKRDTPAPPAPEPK
jgi:hypothetical protein